MSSTSPSSSPLLPVELKSSIVPSLFFNAGGRIQTSNTALAISISPPYHFMMIRQSGEIKEGNMFPHQQKIHTYMHAPSPKPIEM